VLESSAFQFAVFDAIRQPSGIALDVLRTIANGVNDLLMHSSPTFAAPVAAPSGGETTAWARLTPTGWRVDSSRPDDWSPN